VQRQPERAMLRPMHMSPLPRLSVLALVLFLALGCSTAVGSDAARSAGQEDEGPSPATRSCAATAADVPNSGDYLNVVYREGDTFIAGDATSESDFGAVVGRVRCTITGSFTPADYEGQDGDATYIRAGDPLHQVGDRPPSEAVGAYLKGPRYPDGNAYIFVTEQEYRERSAGRCNVPLTQARPS
jgi:hypothetical protein